MSDQTPVPFDSTGSEPTPEPTPEVTSEVTSEAAADLSPEAVAPEAVAPEAVAGAPSSWPAAGAVPPPAYPQAATYPQAPTYPQDQAYPAPAPAYPQGQAYPAPAPAYPQSPPTSSNAIIALILAIVSWAVCPIVPAIVALILASSAAKEIAASGGRVQGAGLVTAARIVSWVNIGLWAAVLVVGFFIFVLLAVAGGVSETNF